jgi:hypothetical protein
VSVGSCGNPPTPLNSTSGPNVLIIGDSISEPGSGYGPAVERILQHPRPGQGNSYLTGALATVQHSGGSGSNQAGPTTNGAACIASWVGQDKWDGECAALCVRACVRVCVCACCVCVCTCSVLAHTYASLTVATHTATIHFHSHRPPSCTAVISMNFGIHDCCPGGDGRKPGVSVPLADYVKVRR